MSDFLGVQAQAAHPDREVMSRWMKADAVFENLLDLFLLVSFQLQGIL